MYLFGGGIGSGIGEEEESDALTREKGVRNKYLSLP